MLQRNVFIEQDSDSFDQLLNKAIQAHNKKIADPAKRIHPFKQQSITLEELLILANGYPDLKQAIFERLINSHRTQQSSFMVPSPVVIDLARTCAFNALSKQEEIALLYEIMITGPQYAITVFKIKDLWEQVKGVDNFRRRANANARLMFKVLDFVEKTSFQDYLNTYQDYMYLYRFITQAGSFSANNERIMLLKNIKNLALIDSVDKAPATKQLLQELKRIKPSFLTYVIADTVKDLLIAPRYFARKCETYNAICLLEGVVASLDDPAKHTGKTNKPIKNIYKHRIFIQKHYEPQQSLRITMTGSSSEDESSVLDTDSSITRTNTLSNNRYTKFASKPQPIPKANPKLNAGSQLYAKSF